MNYREMLQKILAIKLISKVWDQLNQTDSRMIYEATIALNGDLNQPYEYLRDYVKGIDSEQLF